VANLVQFDTRSGIASGYLVAPAGPPRPGVLVVQEWWGLDSGIKQMTDRLGASGFVALAPDLYHGELVGHDEVDAAEQLMRKLPPERAVADMSGAIDYLAAHPMVAGNGIGVVGFCMGGLLAFFIAMNRADVVRALVPFYGFPHAGLGHGNVDWSKLEARVSGHMAEQDSFFPATEAVALETKLRAMGKDVTLRVHPGTGHAFMGPHNAFGTLDAVLAERLWPEVVSFLDETLRRGDRAH
jgi:carboxymethylenebutenolidase